MAKGMSELFLERAAVTKDFCERVGSYELDAEQGLALMAELGIRNGYTLRGALYRLPGDSDGEGKDLCCQETEGGGE